jgi:hypothetical protein
MHRGEVCHQGSELVIVRGATTLQLIEAEFDLLDAGRPSEATTKHAHQQNGHCSVVAIVG